jgi:hypothetical protein
MKNILFLLIALITFSEAMAQLKCNEEFTCRVTAPSGMRMRKAPSLKAGVAGSVPYDSLVKACRETFGTMTYEDQQGYWRKVMYKDAIGYMFDGFLEITATTGQTDARYEKLSELGDSSQSAGEISSITPAQTKYPEGEKPGIASTTFSTVFDFLTEAYNYCGDVQKLDPTLLWYGFYPKSEKGGTNIRIKQVELDIVMSKIKVGQKMEFDIETDQEERSIFLLGLNRPLEIAQISITDHADKLRYAGRKVFPGQELELNSPPLAMKLGATGAVTSSGDCPELKDYKLTLSGEKYGQTVSQDITASLLFKGQCGMPEVYWYGDFTGDGVPEIIFVSVYDEKNHFTLFISDPKNDKGLVKKQSEWIIDKCY